MMTGLNCSNLCTASLTKMSTSDAASSFWSPNNSINWRMEWLKLIINIIINYSKKNYDISNMSVSLLITSLRHNQQTFNHLIATIKIRKGHDPRVEGRRTNGRRQLTRGMMVPATSGNLTVHWCKVLTKSCLYLPASSCSTELFVFTTSFFSTSTIWMDGWSGDKKCRRKITRYEKLINRVINKLLLPLSINLSKWSVFID